MAWGAILGSLLGAGGQIAGGALGGASGGQGRTVQPAPGLDYALQASQYTGLDPLGFGSLNSIPGPIQQLIANLRTTPMTDKTREKLFSTISTIQRNPELLNDPGGNNFTKEQLLGFLRDPSTLPSGRILPEGLVPDIFQGQIPKGSASNLVDRLAKKGVPVKNFNAVQKIMAGQGLQPSDLGRILEEQAAFDTEMQKLKDAGLGGIQTNTILNRAKAAGTAAELLGGAADFARTGQPGQGIGQDLFNRDERQMADLQDRLGVMANFGGINPAQLFESLTDAKLDQNLRLIEQQLGMSNALQATLSPSTAAAANIAGQGNAANLNSAQIAAQQAQASAALRSGQVSNAGSSLANGIAGGLGSLGSGIGNAFTLQSLFGNRGSQMSPASLTSAGLNFDNVAGSFATPGVYGSGR